MRAIVQPFHGIRDFSAPAQHTRVAALALALGLKSEGDGFHATLRTSRCRFSSTLVYAYALSPEEVLILVNKDTAISADVARMYQRLRRNSPQNLLQLSVGASRYVARQQYRAGIALPQ